MLVSAVSHTPPWVFLVFVYLIWQGMQALRTRSLPIWRMLIVPGMFIALGLSRIVSQGGQGELPLAAWAVASLAFLPLGLRTAPHRLVVDRTKGEVSRPGSPVPLVRNMSVFALQCAIAFHASPFQGGQALGSIVGHAISGATSGYFFGWATVLMVRYRAATALPTAA